MPSERTVSRFAFESVVFATIIALSIVEMILVLWVSRRLGFEKGSSRDLVTGLCVPNIILGRVLVDRALKALGLSRSGRMVEGRRPSITTPESASVEDVIEVRCRRSLWMGMMLMLLGIAAFIFLLTEVLIPKNAQEGREYLPLLYGMCLGLAALMYVLKYIKIIRIDSQGVMSYRTPYSIRPTTIPWSRIASCDLIAVRDTFGKIVVNYPVMKGADGKELFRGLAQGLAMASA
jgi:hypothetical protein